VDLHQLDWRTRSYSGENGNSCVEVAPTPTGATWHKSSFSGVNGNSCVEVALTPTGAAWHTSSFSADSGARCVEVAPIPTGVAVRDAQDRTRAPHLHSATAWRAFLAAVRNGEFDRR
jgi:hypothetical protein